jgi:hypothetical protein
MEEQYKIIKNVEEITENDVDNRMKFTTQFYSYKYFGIDKNSDEGGQIIGYSIYGLIVGDMPTSVCTGDFVKNWKTFNGVKNAIKRFAKQRCWGFHRWFPDLREE